MSLSAVERLRACVGELRDPLVVFVAEGGDVAAHLGRLVRSSTHTEARAVRERWSAARLLAERRLDRDFERRSACSRRVLEAGARRQLAYANALLRAMGTTTAPGTERIDAQVMALEGKVTSASAAEDPQSARGQRVGRLARAMRNWRSARLERRPAVAASASAADRPSCVLSALAR